MKTVAQERKEKVHIKCIMKDRHRQRLAAKRKHSDKYKEKHWN